MWLLLLQVNRCPQSSNEWPNWPPPEIASKAEPSGLNRKSRPRTETGFSPGRDQVLDLAAVAAGHAVDPAVGPPEQAIQEPLDVLRAEAA